MYCMNRRRLISVRQNYSTLHHYPIINPFVVNNGNKSGYLARSKIKIMPGRRQFLQTGGTFAAGIFSPPVFAIGGKFLRPDDGIVGHGDFRYKVHKDWADLNRFTTYITNCHEMVVDSQGRLLMIGDDPRNNIIVFDRSGKVLETWGTMYPGGHGLTLNNEGGEDFLYIAECGYSTDIRTGETIRQTGFVTKNKLDGKIGRAHV